MRIKAKVLAGIGVGVLAVLIGQAATASNTIPSSTAGYGTASVSGAVAESVNYTLSADGTTITGATIVFTGNLTGKKVTAGFNTAALGTCTLGAYNAPANNTATICAAMSQNTAAALTLAVAVA